MEPWSIECFYRSMPAFCKLLLVFEFLKDISLMADVHRDDNMVFIGNIPENFGNDLLKEFLELFGEVKEFRRIRNTRGISSSWIFIKYYESASSRALYGMLPSISLGSKNPVMYPAEEKVETCPDREKILEKINDINVRYFQKLEMEDVLNKFISSYNLLYGDADNDKILSSVLKKWLQEESEIRRRCKKMELGLGECLEREKQANFNYLSRYDDDKSNDLFYLDRAAWISKRHENKN